MPPKALGRKARTALSASSKGTISELASAHSDARRRGAKLRGELKRGAASSRTGSGAGVSEDDDGAAGGTGGEEEEASLHQELDDAGIARLATQQLVAMGDTGALARLQRQARQEELSATLVEHEGEQFFLYRPAELSAGAFDAACRRVRAWAEDARAAIEDGDFAAAEARAAAVAAAEDAVDAAWLGEAAAPGERESARGPPFPRAASCRQCPAPLRAPRRFVPAPPPLDRGALPPPPPLPCSQRLARP